MDVHMSVCSQMCVCVCECAHVGIIHLHCLLPVVLTLVPLKSFHVAMQVQQRCVDMLFILISGDLTLQAR